MVPVKGRDRHLESYVENLQNAVDNQLQVRDDIDALRSWAIKVKEHKLVPICDEMMEALNRQSFPTPTRASLIGADDNNRPSQDVGQEEKSCPMTLETYKPLKVRNVSRFAQLIDLTWRAGYYKHDNSEQVTLKEICEAYQNVFSQDFYSQRGNINTLYKGGNCKALSMELENYAQSAEQIQKSIVNELKDMSNAIHEEKNRYK